MQVSTHDNMLEAKVFTRGTMKIPASLRHDLDIHDGDRVLFIKKHGDWIMTTHANNIKNVQSYIAKARKKNDAASVVNELIQGRRIEAVKEFGE